MIVQILQLWFGMTPVGLEMRIQMALLIKLMLVASCISLEMIPGKCSSRYSIDRRPLFDVV